MIPIADDGKTLNSRHEKKSLKRLCSDSRWQRVGTTWSSNVLYRQALTAYAAWDLENHRPEGSRLTGSGPFYFSTDHIGYSTHCKGSSFFCTFHFVTFLFFFLFHFSISFFFLISFKRPVAWPPRVHNLSMQNNSIFLVAIRYK